LPVEMLVEGLGWGGGAVDDAAESGADTEVGERDDRAEQMVVVGDDYHLRDRCCSFYGRSTGPNCRASPIKYFTAGFQKRREICDGWLAPLFVAAIV